MMGRIKKKQPAACRRFVEAGIRDIDAAFIETKRFIVLPKDIYRESHQASSTWADH